MNRKQYPAFTLAELLIALAILGVIASFTIPKVLQAQQNSKFNAIAKEAAGTISGAYSKLSQAGNLSGATKPADLTPYMNYVKYDTASTIDDTYGYGLETCAPANPCVMLHNGAAILFDANPFGGTTPGDDIWFDVDPDWQNNSSTTNGPGKGIAFVMLYNGRISTDAGWFGGTHQDPPWFNWN